MDSASQQGGEHRQSPHRQHRSTRKGDQEWHRRRAVIEDLYIGQNKKLKDVMSIMAEQHGFSASRRQYEYHLALWKACKYNPRRQTLGMSDKKLEASSFSFTSSSLDGMYDDDAITDAASSVRYAELMPTNVDWLLSASDLQHSQPLAATGIHLHTAEMERSCSSTSSSSIETVDGDTLTPFVGTSFIDIDIDVDDHTVVPVNDSNHTHPDHHWQVPKYLSRLWELDAPAIDRTADQQYRVQKLIWCLWMCGNAVCFTNLARGQERIVRVEDDITRFESTIEEWIETSVGGPATASSPETNPATSTNPSGSGLPQSMIAQTMLECVQSWKMHARFGHEFAVLNATGRRAHAKMLLSRLASDLSPTIGAGIFFLSVARILAICQRYLSAEIVTMRALDSDVRTYIGSLFQAGRNSADITNLPSTEARAVGTLASLCYNRWSQDPVCQAYFEHTKALTEQHTGFPIRKIFQWSIRLLLFHSVQFSKRSYLDVADLSPLSLSSMALNGLSALDLGSVLPKAPVFGHHADFQEIKVRLSAIWLKWLAQDSAWFLATISLSDCSENSPNLWWAPATTAAVH